MGKLLGGPTDGLLGGPTCGLLGRLESVWAKPKMKAVV